MQLLAGRDHDRVDVELQGVEAGGHHRGGAVAIRGGLVALLVARPAVPGLDQPPGRCEEHGAPSSQVIAGVAIGVDAHLVAQLPAQELVDG